MSGSAGGGGDGGVDEGGAGGCNYSSTRKLVNFNFVQFKTFILKLDIR